MRALKRIALAQEKETKARLKAGPKAAPPPKALQAQPGPLAPLEDSMLERIRRELALKHGAKFPGNYFSFKDRLDYVWDIEDLQTLIGRVEPYEVMEIRDSNGGPVWRSKAFNLPLAGDRAPTPAAPQVLPDLVDGELDLARARVTRDWVARRGYGVFVSFRGDTRSQVWDSAETYEELQPRALADMSSYPGDGFEIRNATGVPVWRSPDFALPVRGPKPAQTSSSVLPELQDAILSRTRRSRVNEVGERFVIFKDDQSYDYDFTGNLEKAIELARDAELRGSFEIRDERGDPIWRSPGYPYALQGQALPERALPELEDGQLADARRRTAEGTGDPFVAFRGHTGNDYYGSDDSLIALVESLTNEPSYGAYDWEIRTWSGDPVWRSSDFGTSNPYLRLAE